MACQLEIYSKVKVRGTFIVGKHFTSFRIHHELSAVYGPHAMSRLAIVGMVPAIRRRSLGLHRCEKQARPTKVSTSDMVQRVQNIILTSRGVSVVEQTAQELKEHSGARQFSSNNQVETPVLSWVQDREGVFYRQGIKRLVRRSHKCLQRIIEIM